MICAVYCMKENYIDLNFLFKKNKIFKKKLYCCFNIFIMVGDLIQQVLSFY